MHLILIFLFAEEILSSDNALWWSPNGTRVLYGHFDETEVYRYDLAFYGDMSESYVDNRRIPYPKVCRILTTVHSLYLNLHFIFETRNSESFK